MADRKKVSAAFYRTEMGTEPVREWLRLLPPEDRKIVGDDLQTIEYGWPVGMPVCRSLGGGLWELPSTIRRGLFFVVHEERLVLLNGFTKKTQKTPKNELELARKRKKRHRKGEAAMSNKYIGSSVDGFLKEDGIYEETRDVAIKRVLAWQIKQAMKQKRISKREMAQRMKTSRSQVDRLLDPDNMSVQLNTLQRAAGIVGQRLVIGLEPVA